jgi:hypothetical protein
MKIFDKRETTTVIAALRYLQANRDDALNALYDLDDTSGADSHSFLLTEEEIDALCEQINLDGDLTLTEPSMMRVWVAFVGGKVKGILTSKEYLANTEPYWDELKDVEVPVEDWNAEKVTVGTINNYL